MMRKYIYIMLASLTLTQKVQADRLDLNSTIIMRDHDSVPIKNESLTSWAPGVLVAYDFRQYADQGGFFSFVPHLGAMCILQNVKSIANMLGAVIRYRYFFVPKFSADINLGATMIMPIFKRENNDVTWDLYPCYLAVLGIHYTFDNQIMAGLLLSGLYRFTFASYLGIGVSFPLSASKKIDPIKNK